jgi:uncharacterized protein Usg
MAIDIGFDGYHMTTAEIVFQTGEGKDRQQTFIWQDYDLVPTLPRLRRFLAFWTRNAGDELFSVTVTKIDDGSEPMHRVASLSFTVH